MSNNPETKGLSSFDFFTIGFGAIVGVGWALSLKQLDRPTAAAPFPPPSVT